MKSFRKNAISSERFKATETYAFEHYTSEEQNEIRGRAEAAIALELSRKNLDRVLALKKFITEIPNNFPHGKDVSVPATLRIRGDVYKNFGLLCSHYRLEKSKEATLALRRQMIARQNEVFASKHSEIVAGFSTPSSRDDAEKLLSAFSFDFKRLPAGEAQTFENWICISKGNSSTDKWNWLIDNLQKMSTHLEKFEKKRKYHVDLTEVVLLQRLPEAFKLSQKK